MLHALARLLRENEANTRCVQALLPDSRNRSERKTDVHTLRSVPLIRSCDFLCGSGRQSTSEIRFTATRRHTICELPGPMSIYYFKGVLRYVLCVVNGTFATAPDFKRRHAQEVLTSTFVAAHPAVSEVFGFSKTETLFKILRAVLAVNALLCNPIQFAIEHAVCTLHVRLVLRCQFLNLLLVWRLKFAGIACALGVHQTFMFSSFALIRFVFVPSRSCSRASFFLTRFAIPETRVPLLASLRFLLSAAD